MAGFSRNPLFQRPQASFDPSGPVSGMESPMGGFGGDAGPDRATQFATALMQARKRPMGPRPMGRPGGPMGGGMMGGQSPQFNPRSPGGMLGGSPPLVPPGFGGGEQGPGMMQPGVPDGGMFPGMGGIPGGQFGGIDPGMQTRYAGGPRKPGGQTPPIFAPKPAGIY